MAANYEKFFERDYQKLLDKYNKKSEQYKQLKYEYQLLYCKYNKKEEQLEIAKNNFEINAKAKYQPLLDKKDKEIARLKALLNTDGTNAGIPTSRTPINKNKVIPNTREKSDKIKGG